MAGEDKFATIKNFADKSWGRPRGPGFAKESRFKVQIDPPKLFTLIQNSPSTRTFFDDHISINVVNATLPSIELDEKESPFRKGVIKRKPNGTIKIQFYESNNLDIKNFFYNWMNAISTPSDDSMYEVRFLYDEFVSKMTVYHIDETGKSDNKGKCDFFTDVYPISMSNINYNIANENNLVMISVDFSYRYHEMNKP